MATAAPPQSVSLRVTIAVAAAGICSFALLYAPQPLLPWLAEAFALDPASASLTVSVATGALAVAVVPIGVLSEFVGRRGVILASTLCSALLGLALPLAGSYEALLVLRALQGVAIAGFPGVAAAYLVELLGGAGVTAAVGAMIAGNTVGGMLGRLAGGVTSEVFGWRGALAFVAALSLLCALLTAVTLPRRAHRDGHRDGRGRSGTPRELRARSRGVFAGMASALRKPVLLAQYAVALLAMGSFVALYNAAGFRLTSEPLSLPPALASLVFLAYAMGAVSSATVGRLAVRFGRRRCLLIALLVTAVGAALTVADSLPLVVAGFVVLTGGFFAAHAVANGWAAAEAPQWARGPAASLYTLAYYLGSSFGGTAGTAVYGQAGWAWLVAGVALWLGLAALAVHATCRRRPDGIPLTNPRRQPPASRCPAG
ncbi:YNFM family putative membrane transporter [Saccharomonospora amisosensis]|uniref:YNFM family putative membrane transporter n=1 Tax=Saccharomonospora amisosensis TaxID=1128677 RepID=A0A7X5ZSJ0_9PSEU|nr:MFS transporter [Saccharomonospora amisosensis]NIJ13973.1 YNFM family putative membrane transporter [Saccharomonospora amisosensis]